VKQLAPLATPRVGIVLLFVAILLASSLPQPVVAFNVIDHTMCKDVTLSKKATDPAVA
jgi:hypothetical protein